MTVKEKDYEPVISNVKAQMPKSKYRNLWKNGKMSSERELKIFSLCSISYCRRKAVVPERNLLEKRGTNRG